jgi:hypothetical protein
LFTSLAILVKSVAVFPLLGAALGLILSRKNLKRMLADKQTWLVAGITALPTIIFYIYGLYIRGDLASQFSLRFMPALIKDPSFYVRWLFTATGVVGSSALLVSLAGILLFRSSLPRYMLIGGMFGYLVFGFFFPYHFITHEYYHLCLIPLVAIGIIPVAELLFDFLSVNRSRLAQPIVAGILLLGVGMQFWQARNYKRATDYRPEIAYWQALGEKIGHETKIIELTGDYGYRLAYFGWVDGAIWSSTADQELRTLAGQEPMDFASTFAEKTKGKDLFVVSSPPEWEKQATLRAYLTDNYPLVEASDEGYWIFKLER